MISFEISLIDIVLVMAIIILLLVHMGGAHTKDTTDPEQSQKNWKEEIIRTAREGKEESLRRIKKKESSFTPSPEGSVKCPNHFGYLKTLPLGSSAPEECYSCSRMMQCLLSNEDSGEPKNSMISYRR